ncbi:MAG: hypothetical protein N2247_04390 [Leptospiraceae bacterium]|nr:hypothetical protein [Leptospiraceae bacterium]
MAGVIKVETLQFFEDRLGKEEGRKVAEVLERAFEEMEKKAESLALQKKLELKDELTKELATKEDIARLEGMIQSEVARIEGMIKSESIKLESMIKSEVARIETKMESEFARLEAKMESEIKRLEGMIQSEVTRLEGMIKTEIVRLEGKMEAELLKISKEILRIDKKFTILFILIFFAVIFINQNAIEFLLKVFNVIK